MTPDPTSMPLPDDSANAPFAEHDDALRRADRGVAELASARSDR